MRGEGNRGDLNGRKEGFFSVEIGYYPHLSKGKEGGGGKENKERKGGGLMREREIELGRRDKALEKEKGKALLWTFKRLFWWKRRL